MSATIPYGGILAGITDPEFMAKLAERRRIVARIAEQSGLPISEAAAALDAFEYCEFSDGQVLH